MQTIEEILNTINEKDLNVSEISRKTGIPGTRIYKWLDKKGMPKEEDAGKMREWASKNSELFPKMDAPAKRSNDPDPTAMQILAVLADAFKEQAKAFSDQVEIMKDIRKEMARKDIQAIIEANVVLTLETLRTVAARQEADEETILQSLERIEGLPEKKLFQDAGRRKSQIEEAAHKFGNNTG